MSSQLQVPCLGRPFNLGMLYDCRTQKLAAERSLWKHDKVTSAIIKTMIGSCDSEAIIEDSIQKKSSCLKVKADMKLSVLSGMVEVKGAAKYWNDRISSEKQCRLTLKYSAITHHEVLAIDELGEVQNPHLLNYPDATHVVTGIEYGTDAFLILDQYFSDVEDTKKVSGELKANAEKISSYIVDAGANAVPKWQSKVKTEDKKFHCKFYGDFPLNLNPTTFDEAIQLFKNLSSHLDNKSRPKMAYLTPLSELGRKTKQHLFSVSEKLIHSVEDAIEHFHKATVRANDLKCHSICCKFADLDAQLSKFVSLFETFKDEFIQRLSTLLLKIRNEGATIEPELKELIASTKRSPFSQQEAENYLNSKDNEIKLLDQHLKNLENSTTEFRFGAECDLLTLSNDAQFDHVISLAFNVTSKTHVYVESLEHYIETGTVESACNKEWYTKPDVTKQLQTEIEKFLKIMSPTQGAKFIVVSSKSDNVETGPSVSLHTRGYSTPIERPAPPQSSNITSNSVTLTLASPKHGKVDHYNILYRNTESQSEFTEVSNQGYLETITISSLLLNKTYEFKLQAIIGGFKVESESICITTTSYYDIVLVGKTGQGKSTLGNKLLDLDNTDKASIKSFQGTKKRFIQADDQEIKKEQGKSMLSVTDRCKLMANEVTRIRVLDVPGFSDTGTLREATGCKNVTVYGGNLQIARWIVREQVKFQLKVRRIIYFLPTRGYYEKADKALQEELKVLHHYFGKDVFNCIVAVATNHPDERRQLVGFDDTDYEKTKTAFYTALKIVLGCNPNNDIGCPPIIFLAKHDSPEEALHKIQNAIVLKDNALPLHFKEEVCGRCACTIRSSTTERVCVVDADEEPTSYSTSKCHPLFEPTYSRSAKIAGGIGHIATVGIGLLVERVTGYKTWPGFTNSDEECIVCGNSPGSEGCTLIGTVISKDKKNLTTDHINKL